jgi:hypothetical protein
MFIAEEFRVHNENDMHKLRILVHRALCGATIPYIFSFMEDADPGELPVAAMPTFERQEDADALYCEQQKWMRLLPPIEVNNFLSLLILIKEKLLLIITKQIDQILSILTYPEVHKCFLQAISYVEMIPFYSCPLDMIWVFFFF